MGSWVSRPGDRYATVRRRSLGSQSEPVLATSAPSLNDSMLGMDIVDSAGHYVRGVKRCGTWGSSGRLDLTPISRDGTLTALADSRGASRGRRRSMTICNLTVKERHTWRLAVDVNVTKGGYLEEEQQTAVEDAHAVAEERKLLATRSRLRTGCLSGAEGARLVRQFSIQTDISEPEDGPAPQRFVSPAEDGPSLSASSLRKQLSTVSDRHPSKGSVRKQPSKDSAAGKSRKLFLFDWDDTLFPTTWREQLKERGGLEGVPAEQEAAFASHRKAVLGLLESCTEAGKVALVTLAQRPWVETSCEQFCPEVWDALGRLGVEVLYAREFRSEASFKRFPRKFFEATRKGAAAAVAERMEQFVNHKRAAFVHAIGLGRYDDVVVVGDGDFEILAAHDLSFEGRFKSVKAVHLLDEPGLEALTGQVLHVLDALPSLLARKADAYVGFHALLADWTLTDLLADEGLSDIGQIARLNDASEVSASGAAATGR